MNAVTLVENSQSAYTIAYTEADYNGAYDNGINTVAVAAQELQTFLAKTTGATLPIEAVSSLDELSGNYIALGSLAKQKGLTYSRLTTDTGYRMVLNGGNVYLYGNTRYGTLNAVYGFLARYTELEFFTDTVYTYAYTDELIIEGLDETFNPSIDYNCAVDGALTAMENGKQVPNFAYQRRLGFQYPAYVMGGEWHNFLSVISPDEYQSGHPNWFVTATNANDGTSFTTLDLAYNGYEIVPYAAAEIAELIRSGASGGVTRAYFGFTQPDSYGWSMKDSNGDVAKYGEESAEYIIFMNKLAKCLDENYTFDHEVKLMLLAYHKTVEAPAYNEALKFYSTDEVKLGVMYAPIQLNMYRPITESEHASQKYGNTNAYYAAEMQEWKALAGDEIYFWNYSNYMTNYFLPLDTLLSMPANYQFAAAQGVSIIMDQGQCGDTDGTDWSALKIYLKSKLAKDCNALLYTDEATLKGGLIERFFKAYYGGAADAMLGLLAAQHSWYGGGLAEAAVDANGKEYLGNISAAPYLLNTKYVAKECWDDTPATTYDNSMLTAWYENIASALFVIERDTTLTKEEKNEYLRRIKIEGLTVRYLSLKVYGSAIVDGDTVDGLETEAQSYGIDYYAQGREIGTLSDFKW